MSGAEVVANFMSAQRDSKWLLVAKGAFRNAVCGLRQVTDRAGICDSNCVAIQMLSGKHMCEIAYGRSAGSETTVIFVCELRERITGVSKGIRVVICLPCSLKNDL